MALTKISGSILKDPLNLGEVSIGGTLTYQDVTNVDSVGIITARSTIDAQGDVSIADKIIHTGDTNTAIRFPAADTITAETGGSERLRIASDGDVIIGGSSDAGYPDYADNLTIHDTQNSGITIRSGIASQGAVYFSDTTGTAAGTYVGNIIYDHSDNHMRFATSGSERLRINSSGRVGINETSPDTYFHVKTGVDSALVKLENSASSGRSQVQYLNPHGDWVQGIIGGTTDGDFITYTSQSKNIRFYTANNERVRISSTGMVLIGETSVAGGSQKLVIGNGGAENMEFTPGTSAQNGGVLEYIHRGDGSTRPDLSMYVGGGAFKVYTGGNNQRLKITDNGLFLFLTDDTGYAASYTNMVIGNNSASNSGITIASSTSGIGRIHFADNNTGNAIYAGWIAYNHSSNSMLFSTNGSGSEKITINSNGRLSAITAATQINFGNTIGKGGFLLSTTDGQFSISGGGYWGGSNWTATATASTQIRHDGGTGPMKFCFNTGLTAGNNFTPTTRLEITPSGNMKLSDPGVTFSDSSPYFPTAWSGTDGYNTTFTIASSGYANLRFRGEQSSGTEYTMGVGAGIFYMAYDDINNGHRITCAANGVVSGDFNDTSDEKLKKNITSLADGAINKIKQLRPVNFDWKRESDLNGQSGFIAQEVKTVIPDLVQGEEYVEGSIESIGYSVNTNGLVAHLTKALQEAITKIETLETKVAALEGS